MAKRKLSYSQYLTSTPKKKALYFYVKRGVSFLIAVGFWAWLKPINLYLALVVGVIVFFVVYRFIAHYLALMICAAEDMMS